jgi:hypothetical protein
MDPIHAVPLVRGLTRVGTPTRRIKMKFPFTLKAVLALVVLATFVGAGLAEDEPTKDIKKMDGKELYRTQCKVCHLEGSEAGEYTPMSLIMDQWDEFFDETFAETHKEVPVLGDKEKVVPDMFDKDMIKKLRKFCVDHAADSEQPMTCG